jgi:hypothetical protein
MITSRATTTHVVFDDVFGDGLFKASGRLKSLVMILLLLTP